MKEKLEAFERLLNIMSDLRTKCPWDKKQTIDSLRNLSIEEIYELNEAILNKDYDNLKEEEIDAFNKIVTTTTKFIVDIKRRKDLEEIIEFANPSFQILIEKLQFAVNGPLKLALETEIDLEYNYYKAVIFNQKELGLKDKIELENEFIEKRNGVLEKINLLSTYSTALEEIKKGHQSIYDNREKIHKKESIYFIAEYITELKEIKTSFDNINTEK